MNRYHGTLIIFVALFLTNCGSSNMGCEFCGSFNVASFSKKELKQTHEEHVSVRRNLNVNQNSGEDFYTIWLWDEENPAQGWTETMEKNVYISHSTFSIYEDGRWEWKLGIEEFFKSSPFYGEQNYEIHKEYSEGGTWKYLNNCKENIVLEKENSTICNNVIINYNQLEEEIEKKQINTLDTRRFQISKNNETGSFTLKTLSDDSKNQLAGVANNSYSLIDGNVFMTVHQDSNVNEEKAHVALAFKSK